MFQIPNPLFDLAGITCGHFLVPFWTFFGATLIGKAIIKMHIQVRPSHVKKVSAAVFADTSFHHLKTVSAEKPETGSECARSHLGS